LPKSDWAKEWKLPMLPFEKFRDWQEITNSIFWAALRAETANGSLVLEIEEPAAERPAHAASNEKELTPALLCSASGELLPS